MIPVIISGGSGSRLWPVSRQSDPKPFLKLSDGKSLLQNTFLRAVKSDQNITSVITVTNNSVHFRMQDEYQQLNKTKALCDFILEPFGRNTAPAILSAVLFAQKNYSEDEVLLILPADHLVMNTDEFNNQIAKATEIAKGGSLVTFGIIPEYPETGYGYIEANESQKVLDGYKVARFVEKPDVDTAKKYVNSGRYLWNSGMFCGTVKTFLSEFEKHAKDLVRSTQSCLDSSDVSKLPSGNILHLDGDTFAKAEDISIDYALFEKTDKAVVLPCTIGWSDIGSWLSISRAVPQDANNNAIIGDVILDNVHDSLFYSTTKLMAGVDVNNLVVVDTPDAILVADKSQTQNVKKIFQRLKKSNHSTSILHQTVHRPWGTYTTLEEADFYKIKRIEVKSGHLLSLQLHHKRSEHWVVVEGLATVTNGDSVIELKANESTYIPIGVKHRLENKTKEKLVLIEVQCGQYLGEDDIVRFEDVYGRG